MTWIKETLQTRMPPFIAYNKGKKVDVQYLKNQYNSPWPAASVRDPSKEHPTSIWELDDTCWFQDYPTAVMKICVDPYEPKAVTYANTVEVKSLPKDGVQYSLMNLDE
jgi:hypothetical protein